MKFISTRVGSATGKTSVSFREAVFSGLAPNGGLYVPMEQPDLSERIVAFSRQTSFQELSASVMGALIGEELSREAVLRVCEQAFSFEPVIKRLDDTLSLLELFHGPTCAFKDFGASFLASIMEEFLRQESRRTVVLVATSGDTGSAVARAFHGKQSIKVVILYPSGRVSALQEQQLTTLGGNVSALEIQGSFDDCQRLVKQAFVDARLSQSLSLSSANSINLGRLLPQALYYFYGYLQLERKDNERLMFCVPSGNFGNLTAGVYAWLWGMPVEGFIAATNVNDVVPEYLKTGEFRPRPSLKTISNAMDVGHPSNFERLVVVFGGSAKRMRKCIKGVRITDQETLQTMHRVYQDSGILLDPHTAVGVLAARKYRRDSRFGGQILCLATAHPGKFVDIVQKATGVTPELPATLKEALAKEKRATLLKPNLKQLEAFLLDRFL
ncbi:MAG: threonine synthase [Spirochaetaceae bacterium]|nr:MAG: threonine synthase [Spirochaetaceae bacterium]